MKGKDEKDFSRRVHLILSASLTAGLVLSAGMTAMAYTPGTYTASAKGMESDVTVTLTVTEDGIEKADIDSSGETPSIGAAAEETLEQQVMDAQSADIDGVAGATVTSTAVRTALKDCLQQAGGAEDAKEDETEAASSEKDTAETAGKQSGARVAKTNTGITVTKAEDWAEEYPDIYKSYMKNEENSEQTDYLEEYPYLKTLYEGYGFAIQYDSARGHSYVIDDVTSTGRPHKLANCFTCKTSDFTGMTLQEGDAAYSKAFEEVQSQITETFGCFHCHENEPGTLYVTHTYLANALGDDIDTIDPKTLSCAQCHVEYYFDNDTKATSLPYTSYSTMNPDDILNYYNTEYLQDGQPYADWVDENTGVRKIKVQHPEFETYMGEGSPMASTYSCADCHMGAAVNDNGETYTSHYWISPLKNEELLKNDCSRCHADLASEVADIQKKTEERTSDLGYRLEDMTNELKKAAASGDYTEDELNDIRMAARNAQFYWDFVFVENSEGAHNPSLTAKCLDNAEKYLGQAAGLMDKTEASTGKAG